VLVASRFGRRVGADRDDVGVSLNFGSGMCLTLFSIADPKGGIAAFRSNYQATIPMTVTANYQQHICSFQDRGQVVEQRHKVALSFAR
jgi:hypothetical protein